MKRSKLLIGFSVLALLLLTISYGCRKTTMKFKKIDGTWKVTAWDINGHAVTTTATSYTGNGCPAPATVEVTDDAVYTFSGTTFSLSLDHVVVPDPDINNPLSYSSDDDMDLTVDVVINEDGTYQITMTYSYTNAANDVYSGTITTDLHHWYMGESNENNSSVMFEAFPVLDFGSIVMGNIVYNDQIMYFDQELTDKDNMVFNFSGNWTESRTEVEDVLGGACVMTTVTNTTSTSVGSGTMARQE